MHPAVERGIAAVADAVWNFLRGKLIARGMEQTVNILDDCAPGLITEMLMFVLDKISVALQNIRRR